jgi:hypothetical protein
MSYAHGLRANTVKLQRFCHLSSGKWKIKPPMEKGAGEQRLL